MGRKTTAGETDTGWGTCRLPENILMTVPAIGDYTKKKVTEKLQEMVGRPIPEEGLLNFCCLVSGNQSKEPSFDNALYLVVQAFPVAMAQYLGYGKLTEALLEAGYQQRPGETIHFFLARRVQDKLIIEHRLEMLNAEYLFLFRPVPRADTETELRRRLSGILKRNLEEIRNGSGEELLLFSKVMDKVFMFSRYSFDHLQTDGADPEGKRGGLMEDADIRIRDALMRMRIILQELLMKEEIPCTVSVELYWKTSSGMDGFPFFWDPFIESRVREEMNRLFPLYLELIRSGAARISKEDWRALSRDALEEIKESERGAYLSRCMLMRYPWPESLLTGGIRKISGFFEGSELSKSVFLYMCIAARAAKKEDEDIFVLRGPWIEDSNRELRELTERWGVSEEWMFSQVWARKEILAYSHGMQGNRKPSALSFVRELAEILGRPILFHGDRKEDMDLLETVFGMMEDWSFIRCMRHGDWCGGVLGDHSRRKLCERIVSNGDIEMLSFALRKNLIPGSEVMKMAEYAVAEGLIGKVPYLLAACP